MARLQEDCLGWKIIVSVEHETKHSFIGHMVSNSRKYVEK